MALLWAFELYPLSAVPSCFLRFCCIAVFWGLLAACQGNDAPVDRRTLQGTDYRLFQGTPLWAVARAAQTNDAQRLAALGTAGGFRVDAPEPRFGKTVLQLAVANGDYAACEALLRLGADPNAHDRYHGSSAMLEAARRPDPSFVELLLAHGGHPNDAETGPRRPGNTQRNTPLLHAVNSSLATVKVVLAAGANLNYENEFGTTALSRALVHDRYAIAWYLLQHGANPRKPVLRRPGPNGSYPVYLPQYLAEVQQGGADNEEINQMLAFLRAPNRK